jgi:DUF4097 and DUF4098 domain-containing protein YvlB
MNHSLTSLLRTTILSTTLAATLLSAAGCIIVAGNGRGYSSSSWSEDSVSEVRTLTIAHVADTPLDVRTQNGSVEVEQSGTDQVVITATLRARTKERLAATAINAERATDGTLNIRVTWPDGGRKNNEGASFVIRTPGVKKTNIESSNGAISLDGLSGDATLATSNGAINARRHDGFIKADTSNASINLRGIRGTKADTSNAAVTISLADSAQGPVNVDTSNGSITLEVGPAFNGRVAANTSNGRVTNHAKHLKSASMDSSERTTSNTFNFGDGERCTLDTSNGSITIEPR